MGPSKRKSRLVMLLIAFLVVLALASGSPGPSNEMVEHLVREANKESDVRVESVEILAYGDRTIENRGTVKIYRWPFKVQVVKHFNPGNGEIIKLVHQKTVEISIAGGVEVRSAWECFRCDTGLASRKNVQ